MGVGLAIRPYHLATFPLASVRKEALGSGDVQRFELDLPKT